MKQSVEIRALNEVSKICLVCRLDMDMQVERAAAQLRGLEGQRDSEIKALDAVQEGWLQSVSARSFQLMTAAFWSAEILRAEAEVERLDDEIQRAVTVRQGLSKVQTAATARCAAVDDLLQSARHRAQRKHDETVLEAHIGRSFTGWRHA